MRADDVYAILKGKIVKLTEDIKEVGDWKPIRHQGTVQTAEDLPADAKEGYMYNIATDSVYGAAGMNVVKTADGWDPMGPIVNMDLYLSKEEAKKGYQPAGDYLTENKAKKTYQPVGNYSTKEETEKKLNKNQGIDNAGKITGINADGDIVPVFPTGVQYNEETNLLEFGTDPNMLNKGIQLDATLKKSGYAADSAAVGENIDSLKEDISNKITKFYASSQGETHLADSDNGKIMDMMLYGKSEQKQYSGKNLFTFSNDLKDVNGVIFEAKDGIITAKSTSTERYTNTYLTFNYPKDIFTIGETYTFSLNSNDANLCLYALYKENDMTDYKSLFNVTTKCATVKIPDNVDLIIRCVVDINATVNATATIQIEKGSTATSYEPYTGGQPSPSPDYPQEIKSVVNPTVKVCGKNLWNEQWINGTLNNSGEFTSDPQRIVSKDFIDVSPKTQYYSTAVENSIYYIHAYTKDEKYIGYISSNGQAFTTPDKCYKLKFVCESTYGNTYKNDIAIIKGTSGNYEPYHEQTVTLPYTLNAIPVSSGGNVTIGSQQYVADYVDVERGKLVRMCKEVDFTTVRPSSYSNPLSASREARYLYSSLRITPKKMNVLRGDGDGYMTSLSRIDVGIASWNMDVLGMWQHGQGELYANLVIRVPNNIEATEYLKSIGGCKGIFISATSEEIDLTTEELQSFKLLQAYYPTTNISINSEQLDGYTVFNYPISMENGWNYVKKQLNDNRDYIYDMDVQSAEAYVNSEYAVALTELEV